MVVIYGLRTTALAGLATLRESSSRREKGRQLSLKWRINKQCCSVHMADFLISAVPDTGLSSTPLSREFKEWNPQTRLSPEEVFDYYRKKAWRLGRWIFWLKHPARREDPR